MKNRTMHELLAVHWLAELVALCRLWRELHDETCVRYGHGPLTSGIGNATAAPDEIKVVLRDLSRRQARALDDSLTHWKASGRRTATWRRYKDSLIYGEDKR